MQETEIEYKFIVPAARLAAVRKALRAAGARSTALQARYHDTADSLLARHGIVLRVRREGRRWVQTTKARGNDPLQRLEHNVDLGPVRAGIVPRPDIARHAGTPLGERLEGLREGGDLGLVETYATDIRRLAVTQGAGAARIEIALDTGRIAAPGADPRAPLLAEVCELELELSDGPVHELTALARRWCEAYGLWFSSVSKSERGRRLMQGDPVPAAVKAAPVRLRPEGEAGAALSGPRIQRAVVSACLVQILPNASEVAAGSEDEEHIHQLRVGLRRLRSALRELAALGPGLESTWDAPLAQAFRALGTRRDAQMRESVWLPRLNAAGAPALAREAAIAAPATPSHEAVRAPGFQDALVALIGFSATPANDDVPGALDEDAALAHIRHRLDRLARRVLRDGRRFDGLEALEQHAVRKRLKRLRYLAEFVAGCFPGAPTRRWLNALEPVQDALGAHCDALAARAHFLARAEAEPGAWFAVGWLSARLARSARACRKRLIALEDVRVFWKPKR
jgi:inorganic triphosphatase YgiF